MDYSTITRLEDLPVEILMEIFIYFTADKLHFSFAQLNNRFNLILKSLSNLALVVNEHVDSSVLSFFYSFNKILVKPDKLYIRCNCKFHSINGGNCLYEIYPDSDNWWYPHYSEEIENIICSDICSQLQTLVLPATSLHLAQLIFCGKFSRLRICHLGKCKPIIFPLPTTVHLHNRRQLTIRQQNGCALETILLICPSLVYLDFSCDDAIPSFVRINNYCFSSMKYLRLGRLKKFFFHNEEFDFLLSLFPNLRQFHLVADQSYVNVETIEFREIASCLRHQCPLLKILVLCIYMQRHMRFHHSIGSFKEITQMHDLFNYVDKCESRLIISSHGFIQHQAYNYRYSRPSSK
ncbi:unnamed protein product [Adineta steineri]|uniref:F-box domain-containing protein n=1 Tax=Adineta steineri TaxID=433720 RepID=A0A813Y178_9BILA|nr:unnamed protein product [Adineta steineri]